MTKIKIPVASGNQNPVIQFVPSHSFVKSVYALERKVLVLLKVTTSVWNIFDVLFFFVVHFKTLSQ